MLLKPTRPISQGKNFRDVEKNFKDYQTVKATHRLVPFLNFP